MYTYQVHCKPAEKAAVSNKIEKAEPKPVDTESADLDSPTSLLTSSSVCVAPLGQPSSAEHVATVLPRAYSVLKLRYITRCVVQHHLRVIEHYLALRVATPAEVGPSSQTAPVQQWGAYVLLAATAAEGLAHVAFSAGAAFEEHLRQVCIHDETVLK